MHILQDSGYFSCFPWNFTPEIAAQPAKIDPLAHAWPLTAVLGNGSSCTRLLTVTYWPGSYASNVLYRANTSSSAAVQNQMQNKKVLKAHMRQMPCIRANTSSSAAVQNQMPNKKVLNLKLIRWYNERCWNISLVRRKHDLFRKNIDRHFASILLAL